MSSDSSVAGFLPSSDSPGYDDALDLVLHDTIVGITGISGGLVRPRWQPEPPATPDFSVNWVAFGITATESDAFHTETHNSPAQDTFQISRDEIFTVLHSFYGPNCQANAARLRAGLSVGQNRDALLGAKLGLIRAADAQPVPALIQGKWVRRIDVAVTYRRHTETTFPVLLLETPGSVSVVVEN